MKKLIALSLFAFLAGAADVTIPIDKYQLKNGLRVILSKDKAVPVVRVYMIYTAGAPSARGSSATVVPAGGPAGPRPARRPPRRRRAGCAPAPPDPRHPSPCPPRARPPAPRRRPPPAPPAPPPARAL